MTDRSHASAPTIEVAWALKIDGRLVAMDVTALPPIATALDCYNGAATVADRLERALQQKLDLVPPAPPEAAPVQWLAWEQDAQARVPTELPNAH